jgi:pimeloyl-ACP methyl ester carboxylesterase
MGQTRRGKLGSRDQDVPPDPWSPARGQLAHFRLRTKRWVRSAPRAQRRWPEQRLQMMIKQMPAADAATINRPEERHMFLQEARRAWVTTGKATAQDVQLFSHDWGFKLEDIQVPVHLWRGDAGRNVPVARRRQMVAAIPKAALHGMATGYFWLLLATSG